MPKNNNVLDVESFDGICDGSVSADSNERNNLRAERLYIRAWIFV